MTSVTSTSIAITWTAPAAGDSPITGYDIKFYPEGSQGNVLMEHVTKTAATLSKLKPFTTYNITVAALSSYGKGLESDAVMLKTRESGICHFET